MSDIAEISDINASSRGSANLDDIIFTLSVNFLLYVVLIIVFYMLVRFYFEEDTNIDEIITQCEGGNLYIPLSTTEDDLELELTETVSKSEKYEFDNESDSSGKYTKEPHLIKRFDSFLNLNESQLNDKPVNNIPQIVFCASGLIITFGFWGLIQERLLTQTYDGEYFEYSYGLVFINRLFGLLISSILFYVLKVKWIKSPLWEYSIPSVANMLSSWCQYEALKYISFPSQMLAKAFKILPVLLMGQFLHNKTYESYEYYCAIFIGFGLYLFIYSSEMDSYNNINYNYKSNISLNNNNAFIDSNHSKNSIIESNETVTGTYCGIFLLILFLFFDSFTGQWQTRMFEINKLISPLQMMLIMNIFSVIFSFITLIHQNQLLKTFEFLLLHNNIYIHLIIFAILSIIGQLFIFYTIKSFGAVMLSIIMSLRILTSTLLSCIVYSHPINELSILGIIIVFSAISIRIMNKIPNKSIINWCHHIETKVIMNEWHEQIDL